MFLAHFRAETPQMAHFTSWRFERRVLEGVSHRRGKRHDVATEESPFQDRNEKLAGCLLYFKSGPLFSELLLKMGPLIFMLTIHD